MHVAIIMDGNGRWATDRGLPRVFGHRAGVKRVEETVRAAPDLGITALTLYAFSTENWKRPDREVNALFTLLRVYFNRKAQELFAEGVRVRFIGNRDRLSRSVVQTMARVEDLTALCTRLMLNIAVDYGGRDEMLRVMRGLVVRAAAGEIGPEAVTADAVHALSDLAELAEPDLLIRTGGERRLSNFLLWHVAYSELDFLPMLWPDFTTTDLTEALARFRVRERRFGGVVRKTA